MAMASRTTRILILLVIDVCFFLLELIVGYAVGSLALVADSFHMLNDVMSLIVALYAIKLSGNEASTRYSYGWHRAEILAALINGVFLLALCFSIFMEAIERFVSVPEISNPKLVVIVGCLGLASNILGLLMFHEHGHSHSHDHDHHSRPDTPAKDEPRLRSASETQPLLIRQSPAPAPSYGSPRSVSPTQMRRRADSSSSLSLYGHPAQTRASVIAAAQDVAYRGATSPTALPPILHSPPSHPGHHRTRSHEQFSHQHLVHEDAVEDEPSSSYVPAIVVNAEDPEHGAPEKHHHHGSMNMRALVLHVLGDALGNVGVILSGLIVWKTTWEYRFYSDPFISIIITIIIFSSALPLVKSASFILLQGVPESVDLENVRRDIGNVEGVKSLHELHVWQLSESKLVASVHVMIPHQDDYMRVVRDIRQVLHDHGVHSGTVQPEFASLPDDPDSTRPNINGACLVACPPGMCAVDQICCPPSTA